MMPSGSIAGASIAPERQVQLQPRQSSRQREGVSLEKTQLIAKIEELTKKDNDLVGKKCANLGELHKIGVRVPSGFALSVAAWERFVELTGIEKDMRQIFSENKKNLHQPSEGQKVSASIRALIEGQTMPYELRQMITEAYRTLGSQRGVKNMPVAVRSAGVVSMPGAMETYLNVRGEDEVVEKVLRVWSSAYTYRAILYRENQGLNPGYAPIGVAVLQLVNAKCAGVLMSANPTSGNTNEMVIESNWGLGESVVSGVINPDRFTVSKEGLSLAARVINTKMKMFVPKDYGSELIDTPPNLQATPCLEDREVLELARISLEIEKHFEGPTDIEFAYASDIAFPDSLYFIQARPMKALPKYRDAVDKILDRMLG